MIQEEFAIEKKAKDKLKEWKQRAEELNVQLHLGKEEAKDEFKKQKKNLVEWLENLSNDLKDAKEVSSESLIKLESAIDSLRLQAALGKVEAEHEVKEQQQKIADGIHQLKQEISNVFSTTEDKVSHVIEESNEKLDDFYTRFDLFRLQLHLGREDVGEKWEEKKKELSHKLHQVKVKLEEGEEVASEKWDDFASEMTEGWEHIRDAFKS